jgi:hypothetical protein
MASSYSAHSLLFLWGSYNDSIFSTSNRSKSVSNEKVPFSLLSPGDREYYPLGNSSTQRQPTLPVSHIVLHRYTAINMHMCARVPCVFPRERCTSCCLHLTLWKSFPIGTSQTSSSLLLPIWYRFTPIDLIYFTSLSDAHLDCSCILLLQTM